MATQVWLSAIGTFGLFLIIAFVGTSIWSASSKTAFVSTPLILLGRAATSIDRFLVHKVSCLFGVGWSSGRFAALKRWTHLATVFISLSALGALAAAPIAIVALISGVLGVVAILRVWAWDEEDRADDVPREHRRIGCGEDFRSEALFAAACAFLLSPVLFFRLDEWLHLFGDAPIISPLGYAGFVAGEFLKALPLLDYSEIYNVRNVFGHEPSGITGQNLNFALRSFFDIAILGALVRMAFILKRIRDGRDLRAIEELLHEPDASKHLEAVERLKQLGLRRQANAQRMLVTDILQARDAAYNRIFDVDVLDQAALALTEMGNTFNDPLLLRAGIDGLRIVVHRLPPTTEEWASATFNLGWVLRTLGERTAGVEGADLIVDAAAAFRRLSEFRDAGGAPTAGAVMSKRNLGTTLFEAGLRDPGQSGRMMLVEAVEALRAALELGEGVVTKEEELATRSEYSNALRELGDREIDPELRRGLLSRAVDEARRAYEEMEFTENRFVAGNHLALALRSIGNETKGSAGEQCVLEAVRLFTKLLDELGPDTGAFSAAVLKNNLGISLMSLAMFRRSEENEARLVRAAKLFQEVGSTNRGMDGTAADANINLGQTLSMLAEYRDGSKDLLEQAVASCKRAVFALGRLSATRKLAVAEDGLGGALTLLGMSLRSAEGDRRIVEGLKSFLSALARLEPESDFGLWSQSATNAIKCLEIAATQQTSTTNDDEVQNALIQLEASLSDGRAAMRPIEWAELAGRLGNVYNALSDRRQVGASDNASRAARLYQTAAEVFESEGAVEYAAASRYAAKHAGLMSQLRSWVASHNAGLIEEAQAHYTALVAALSASEDRRAAQAVSNLLRQILSSLGDEYTYAPPLR